MTRHFNQLAATLIAAAALGACASDYDGGYYGSGYSRYDHGPRSARYNEGWYDGWYDNFYGPVYGGYWDGDGYFYYQSRVGAPFIVDRERHFRRDEFQGGARFHMQDHRGRENRRNR